MHRHVDTVMLISPDARERSLANAQPPVRCESHQTACDVSGQFAVPAGAKWSAPLEKGFLFDQPRFLPVALVFHQVRIAFDDVLHIVVKRRRGA